MPPSKRSLTATLALATGLAAVATTGHAANPLGTYEGAKIKAKLELNPVGRERLSVKNGTVKVKRRSIKAKWVDVANDRSIKLDMRLVTDVLDVTDQIVEISRGEVFVKDLVSGAPIASGGDFVRGKFRIWRKDDADRTWKIKHDQRIQVTDVSGVLTGLSKGKLKAKR